MSDDSGSTASKRMAKESIYLPDGTTKEFWHDVRPPSPEIPKTYFCRGCNTVTRTGLIDPYQLVCWECCWGHSPGFDTKDELIAWLAGGAS